MIEIANVFNAESAFHPIYSLDGSSAMQALRSLERKPLDAIVMLGTGMPTLAPIASAIGWAGAPVMSCNLCLAWRVVEALDRSGAACVHPAIVVARRRVGGASEGAIAQSG